MYVGWAGGRSVWGEDMGKEEGAGEGMASVGMLVFRFTVSLLWHVGYEGVG